jgi:hypothetical protein
MRPNNTLQGKVLYTRGFLVQSLYQEAVYGKRGTRICERNEHSRGLCASAAAVVKTIIEE